MKMEMLKKVFIVELVILAILVICTACFPTVDFVNITITWIGVIGVTVAVYAWKAKSENRIKVPLKVLESLPEDMRDQLDLTAIITAIIQSE